MHFANQGFDAVVGVVVEVALQQLGTDALRDDESFVHGAVVVLGAGAVIQAGDQPQPVMGRRW